MPSPAIQFSISLLVALPPNLRPAFQLASGARECRLRSLLPIPLEWEVQKGMMVFPLKSPLSRNVLMMRGASPHQIG